ncbi:unnamed protein product [Vicia faba]|uniref:Uncharacterized protein n=1 Tax=Vicia faba TaxID=3906 RepID=A0AAV0ZRY0_VICFA|nr:unnamed protein product [Vicia faba]
MLYHLEDAQGIRVAVNISTLESSPSPLVATALAPTPYPTLDREASALVFKVGQHVDVIAIFTVEEPTSPPVRQRWPRRRNISLLYLSVLQNGLGLQRKMILERRLPL